MLIVTQSHSKQLCADNSRIRQKTHEFLSQMLPALSVYHIKGNQQSFFRYIDLKVDLLSSKTCWTAWLTH